MARRHHDVGFVLIAVFKLIKGALLFVVGMGALSLLHKDVNDAVSHWTHTLQLNAQVRWIQNLVIKLGVFDNRKVALIVGTTVFYAVLLAIPLYLVARRVQRS